MTFPGKNNLYLIAAAFLLTPLLCIARADGEDKHDPFLSFQVPESKATFPLSINEARTVTGYYINKSGVTGGFVRYDDGLITTFDVPGSILTEPVSINTAGDITGFYEISSSNSFLPYVQQGFVRSADGQITTFAGDAYTLNGLAPVSINVTGEIVGNFPDISFASNFFVRSATGVISTSTLSLGANYPTLVTGLNASGAIVGYESSGQGIYDGFLWDGQGPLPSPASSTGLTGIVVPGSTSTFPTALNAEETVVGCYTENGLYYDFVRYPDGVIETLNIPGTIPGCLANSGPLGIFEVNPQSITINDLGTITGYYTNAAKVSRAFVRFEDGTLITFHHPGSRQTIPTGINNCDAITGYYSEGTAIVGFIREP